MAITPKNELADEITQRLHDPKSYVPRGEVGGKPEPLKMWQTRALMTFFEDVQFRENADGDKVVLVMRGPWRDKK